MNPLNSIINITEHLQNKNRELLSLFPEDSVTESEDCTPQSKMSKGSSSWMAHNQDAELPKMDEQEEDDDLNKEASSSRSRVPISRTDLTM
mmetsp:Transcript_23538/g.36241  ORF Transcript_23538/g.36241 Transcript_23538/m.36241 type:complete len:91 (-) Transcript_23538:3351-3623(-)